MEHLGYIAIPFLILAYILFWRYGENKKCVQMLLSRIAFGAAMLLISCGISMDKVQIKYWFGTFAYFVLLYIFGTLALVTWFVVFTLIVSFLSKKIYKKING